MSNLSDYRAKIKELILAEDANKAFETAGFGSFATAIVTGSKSFGAVRSVANVASNFPKQKRESD